VSKIFVAVRIVDAYGTKKSLSEKHVSILVGKLKAHKYFGQGNRFQGFFQIIGSPTRAKIYGAPGTLHSYK
jgi:hypothetical protein